MGLLECLSRWTVEKSDPAERAEKEEMELQLCLAQEQRSIMAITFLKPELAEMAFSGPCLGFEGDTIFIDAPNKGASSVYRGEAVQVCFTTEHRDTTTMSCFRFTSTVRGYDPENGFILDTPAKLHSNQRREFVRIAPPPKAFLQMSIWPLESETCPPLQPYLTECCSGQKNTKDVALVNLSVAGLQMRLKNPLETPAANLGVGAHVLCFLRLQGTDTRRKSPYATAKTCEFPQADLKPLELWLWSVVKYYEKTEQADVIMGVNFAAWAKPGSEDNTPTWTKTDPKGQVSLLNDWVWRQQLQRI